MADNDEKRDFWEVAERKIGVLAAVLGAILGLITTVVAFLKTPYGPYVLPLIVLVFVTGYAFLKSLTDKTVVETLHPRREPLLNRLKRVPWWGWGSLAAIPLLILFWVGQPVYTPWGEHQPPDRLMILIADFHQIDTMTDHYAMTEKLIHNLRAELANQPKTEVVSLGQPISKRQPADFAHNIGAERKATIVIWGCYAVTPVTVDLWVHFELLKKPARLPIEVERTGRAGIEVQASLEQWESLDLRDRVVSELTYLTLFTLGLVHHEAGDVEYAITHFSNALAQVGESPMQMAPLNQCVVYSHRGSACYDKGDYDQAMTDFDKAIELCPTYAAAYNNRGRVYAAKGDLNRAIADWDKGTQLQMELPAAH